MFRCLLALLKVYADIQAAVEAGEPFQFHNHFDLGREQLNFSSAGILSDNTSDEPSYLLFDGNLFWHLIGLTSSLTKQQSADGDVKDSLIREYSLAIPYDPDNPDSPKWMDIRVELQLLRGE